jgi:putative oxygen-independent coproporphyrinogen III oxidase
VSPLPPLALYVHLPWCLRKCPYCDFNSYEIDGGIPEREYVAALLRDLDIELSRVHDRPLTSIFFGGGTPSLFSGGAIASLLDGIRSRIALAADVEITLEANPGAAEAAHFAAYRESGINRLSIGVQSLRDSQLQRLGRVHSVDEAGRAHARALGAGFDNINLDLMYALPGDRLADAMQDLDGLIAMQPAHISWYQLTMEPNTAFQRHPPPRLPDDDAIAAIEAEGRERLGTFGYTRYEISAYARPGRQCVHNLNYWQFGDYIGIGAGAHGKLTGPDRQIVRRARQRNPRMFMGLAGSEEAVATEAISDSRQLIVEFVMNALRLSAGFSYADFAARTGCERGVLVSALLKARACGLVEFDDAGVRPSSRGLLFLNDLITLFDETTEPSTDAGRVRRGG